jgi:hypothetical protein
MPIDIIRPFLDILERADKAGAVNGTGRVAAAAAVPLLS